jgi:hypothetical protein
MRRIASRGGRDARPPRPLRIRPRAFVLAGSAALTLAVVGIAAGQTGGGPGRKAEAVQAVGPACGRTGEAVARPNAIPAELLPPGTVLTSSTRRGGRVAVTGVISRDFRAAVAFFVSGLPKAGYRNIAGDAEMDEAEAVFAGEGLQGKWKVNGILGCADAVTLALYVSR